MAAMDTGKVEMRKAPGAKKAEEALSTAADFIPFVGAGKSAMQGDYGSAALQAGVDVAGGPLLKGAAALGGKAIPALAGIFIGPKAKTWNKAAADEFNRLVDEGEDWNKAHGKTGTHFGADSALRQEISDKNMRLRSQAELDAMAQQKRIELSALESAMRFNKTGQRDLFPRELSAARAELRPRRLELETDIDLLRADPSRTGYPLRLVMEHPELYKAYPNIGDDVMVRRGNNLGKGVYGEVVMGPSGRTIGLSRLSESPNASIKPEETMIHELQHVIQDIEGFEGGSSPYDAMQLVGGARARELMDQGMDRQTALKEANREFAERAGELYSRMAGEAEARATEARRQMTPEERLATHPQDQDYDNYVPYDRQLMQRDYQPYAHGGEVHAANGLPLTFAYDKEDPDALQNWMRESQFGKVDIPAPYKVTPEEVTVARAMRTPAPEMSAKDKLRTLLQEGVKQGKKEVKTLGDPNAVTDLVNRGLIANNPVSGAIDLVNMGLEPFGLGSEMPIGGSAHVQKLMKDYGFTKQERPLLETGLALASPFMPAAAKATEGMTAGLAIKPVGGQWLSGSRGPKSVGEFRARDDAINLSPESIQRKRDITDAHRRAYEAEPTETNRRLMETSRAVLEGAERHAAVNNWIDSNLQNYLRKQMGTPDDPVLKLAEEGVLHMPYRDVPLMSDVSRAREIAGFPALGTATTDLGRMWETLTDAQIASINAGTLRDPAAMREIFDQRMAMDQNLRGNRVPGQPETLEEKSRAWDWGSAPAIVQSIREQNPWLEKLNPDEMVYRMRNRGDLGETLGVDHIIDVLREDMTVGRIRPEQLSKMSMEQAVRRTAEYDAERAAAMAKASAEEMKGMTIAKEFEDGYKMVQLDKPGQFAKESDRMGHSVRGYEPSKGHEDWSEASGNSGYSTYGHGGWDSIKSGETQVFSLRDAKNKPHVTVEVFRTDYVPNKDVEEMLKRSGIEGEPAKAYMLKHGVIDERGNLLPDDPNAVTHKITQIKGKQNAAPNEEYLPMIQRFIREGNYKVEGDLGNTGLIDARSSGMGKQWEYDKKFYYPDMPAYMTESEFNRWRSTGEFTPDQHFGEGGMKRGGLAAVHMAGGGDVAKALAKALKASEKVDEVVGGGMTAAGRAAAGRAAAKYIKSQPQVKASEALGQLMEKGYKKTATTQTDRTRVGGGNIGGGAFPALSVVDPAYAGKAWGLGETTTAARLANLTDPETAWTTMLGSPTQLKTNPIIFDKLKREFLASMKAGNLSPELESKINHNLALTFGEGAQIRDPNIWKQADTFQKRDALASLMMGQGIPPKKGGVALGGEKSGKGVIFRPTDILKTETEPSLLHPEHGGDVPTFALGPRLFSLEKEFMYRPDLHPGFPVLMKGEDLGYNMQPVPTEVYLPDWHREFREKKPERFWGPWAPEIIERRKDQSYKLKGQEGPGYYDLALGLKDEGLPSQELNDAYIRHLIREGFKAGGPVKKMKKRSKNG